jgi:dolichol-phosphate mannosyltransferase
MENKEKNFISAVIYVHNDENSIEEFLSSVVEVLQNNFQKSEIICVNDGSTDNSVNLIKKASSTIEHTTITILNMSYFHGVELAMNAGVDLAIGDFVLEFDTAVHDFDNEIIMKVYRKSLEGYDIVSASPDKRQKFTSNIFYQIFNSFTNLSYKMYTESFRILSRRVINRISSMNKSVPYRKAVYNNCGLKTENLKYKTIDILPYKKDKAVNKYRKNLAMDTLILFTDVGYRFSMAMTAFMMALTVLMAIYAIAIYLTNTPVAGWTTTILFMAFAFFGLFGILTIIIKYLSIVLDLVFKRQRYSFESIQKLTK